MVQEAAMDNKNPWRFGPTRGELWFWLWTSLGGFGLMAVALVVRGIPEGPAIAEVVGLATVVFGYLGGRSVKRLIRREHP
jgi:FtsH-binding integral membrane protein